MEIPGDLQGFCCGEYLASEWAKAGLWDEPAQLMFILPLDDVEIRPELDFMVVGRPGVDGIEFGYRRNQPGIWVYYPIEREFVLKAASLHEFVRQWYAGQITV